LGWPTVRLAIISTVLVLVTVIVAFGQQPEEPSKTRPFHWDYRNAERIERNHTIGNAPELSPADRTALLDAMAVQMKDWDIDSGEQVRDVAADIPIKLIDLNGDGVPEVIAQSQSPESGCSATGNCPFWVFRREKDKYAVLLGDET
jgi:hypothetical protein